MPVLDTPVPKQGCPPAPWGHPILSILFLAEEASDPRWMGSPPAPSGLFSPSVVDHSGDKVPGGPEPDPWEPLGPRAGGQREAAEHGQDRAAPGDLGVAWGGRTPGSLLAGWLEKRVRCALCERTLGSSGRLGTWISGSLGCLGGGTSGSLGSLGTRTPGSLGSWVLRTPGSSLRS